MSDVERIGWSHGVGVETMRHIEIAHKEAYRQLSVEECREIEDFIINAVLEVIDFYNPGELTITHTLTPELTEFLKQLTLKVAKK